MFGANKNLVQVSRRTILSGMCSLKQGRTSTENQVTKKSN